MKEMTHKHLKNEFHSQSTASVTNTTLYMHIEELLVPFIPIHQPEKVTEQHFLLNPPSVTLILRVIYL